MPNAFFRTEVVRRQIPTSTVPDFDHSSATMAGRRHLHLHNNLLERGCLCRRKQIRVDLPLLLVRSCSKLNNISRGSARYLCAVACVLYSQHVQRTVCTVHYTFVVLEFLGGTDEASLMPVMDQHYFYRHIVIMKCCKMYRGAEQWVCCFKDNLNKHDYMKQYISLFPNCNLLVTHSIPIRLSWSTLSTKTCRTATYGQPYHVLTIWHNRTLVYLHPTHPTVTYPPP